jgi:putative redox protein
MAAVTPKAKTVVTMKLSGSCASHSRTDVAVRDVKSTIDEPAERGGTNQGLTPTETLMASLIGCTNVITHKVAEKNGVHIDAMSVRLEAQFDRRGVTLTEEVNVPFPSVTLTIDLVTAADAAAVERVKRDLHKFCPVSKVLRACGTELKEMWNVRAP